MDDFETSVNAGLNLTKRINYGKSRSSVSYQPPKITEMEKYPAKMHFPAAPMVYAAVTDPGMVENPDIPSYQPHVHGRCYPPALIPLQMNEIELDLNCYINSAFFAIRGSWRVHCVSSSRHCDCRLVIPMSEQSVVLGVEVDVSGRLYSTELIQSAEAQVYKEIKSKNEDGGFFRPQLFSLTIPQVEGGSIVSIEVRCFQQLLSVNGQFSLSIPFTFPQYIIPPGRRSSRKEKIQLNVNSGTGMEVICKIISHPLKEIRHHVDKLSFTYEAEVDTWSSFDFYFSYMEILGENEPLLALHLRKYATASALSSYQKFTVSSNDIFGGLLSQSPAEDDFDQRELFCLFLFPGNTQNRQVFRKDVVFLVDISESMRERPLEEAKQALLAALSRFTPTDSFNIIAFNGETCSFSSSLEFATKETVERASQWIIRSFVAVGGTNILQPLNEAMRMLSNNQDSIPYIFLITDGVVEDEQDILNTMKSHVANRGPMSPRISTFGIGSYCNHYFLRMLALTSRGYYDAAYDADSIDLQMQRLFAAASSTVLRNLSINNFDHLDELEMCPFSIPDLVLGGPLIVSGRYQGKLLDSLKVKGSLVDNTDFEIDLKVQKTKDIPLDKIFAKQQIDLLTAKAWFSKSKQIEDQVTNLSLRTGFPSEYTSMVLLQHDRNKHIGAQEGKKIDLQKYMSSKGSKLSFLYGLNVGFGSLAATTANIPPTRCGKVILPESGNGPVLVFDCYNFSVVGDCCCLCCSGRTCSRLSDNCTLVFAQLCTALSCFGLINCCLDLCGDNCNL